MPSRHEEFRRSVRDLTILARRDLARLLGPTVDPRDAKRLLEEILPELIRQYGLAAGTLAADYYDEVRDDARVVGRFAAQVQEPEVGGSASLVRWALSEANDGAAFQSLIHGGVQRRVANTSRSTIMRSSLADPRASGWMRIGVGECDFCAMLVGRGAVYRTAETVQFAAHDDCNCNYAPAFDESQTKKVLDEFVPSARRRSKSTVTADQSRAKEWIAEHL